MWNRGKWFQQSPANFPFNLKGQNYLTVPFLNQWLVRGTESPQLAQTHQYLPLGVQMGLAFMEVHSKLIWRKTRLLLAKESVVWFLWGQLIALYTLSTANLNFIPPPQCLPHDPALFLSSFISYIFLKSTLLVHLFVPLRHYCNNVRSI